MASLRPSLQLKPDLSLLVSLAHETKFHRNGLLPLDLYRPESVATAINIGQGSVFAAYRQKVPLLPLVVDVVDMGGWTTSTTIHENLPPLPGWIVYKVAQIEFEEDGSAVSSHRHRLAAALIELLVLTHEPVRYHPNLPKLFGIAWGQNRFTSSQSIPIPMVDWADCGSLALYQSSAKPLSRSEKASLTWQIGVAVEFLHACGIYHGDIKTENVLLKHNSDGSLQAIVTDFSMSVVAEYGYLKYLPPGTLQWAAPEILQSSSVPIDLAKADTFSFGLLVWRLFCNGHDPLLRIFLDPGLTKMDSYPEASKLQDLCIRPDELALSSIMQCDRLAEFASTCYWIFMVPLMKLTRLSTWPSIPDSDLTAQLLRRLYKMRDDPSQPVFDDHAFLQQLFRHALCSKPADRDLSKSISETQRQFGFTRSGGSAEASTIHADYFVGLTSLLFQSRKVSRVF